MNLVGGGSSRRRVLVAVVLLALLAAGGAASAIALRTITLGPGQCRRVNVRTRVCAAKAVTRTVTVAPSSTGQTFSGNGTSTLAPMTLSRGVTVRWTAQPDEYGFNLFSVSSNPSDTKYVFFDNGNKATSGSSYVPAGTYTFSVLASGAWTLAF